MVNAPVNRPATVSALTAGLKCRCPRCGKGPLFKQILNMRDACSSCGLDYKFVDTGDGPAVFAIFILGVVVLGGALFVLASLTDWLDGYLARAWQQQSTLGRMLDPIADKLLVGATLLMLVQSPWSPRLQPLRKSGMRFEDECRVAAVCR